MAQPPLQANTVVCLNADTGVHREAAVLVGTCHYLKHPVNYADVERSVSMTLQHGSPLTLPCWVLT